MTYSLVLLALLAGLLVFYMYCISSSVIEIVTKRELMREVALVQTDITQLESSFIDAQHRVSEEIAVQHGFIAQREKLFLSSSDSTLVVSYERP